MCHGLETGGRGRKRLYTKGKGTVSENGLWGESEPLGTRSTEWFNPDLKVAIPDKSFGRFCNISDTIAKAVSAMYRW